MSKDTIQFGLIILGQCIALFIGIWKIGKWTESINKAVTELHNHIEDDLEKFKEINNKLNELAIKIAEG